MSNIVQNLQQVLYEILSGHNELNAITSGIYTTMIGNEKFPYTHITNIKLKKVPWINSHCYKCEFIVNIRTESHDNLLCLKITNLLEQVLNAQDFFDKLKEKRILVTNFEVVHNSIAQNSNTLVWESVLNILMFIENME